MTPQTTEPSSQPDQGRRDFLKKSSAVTVAGAAASSLAFPTISSAEGLKGTIRIGLIGCGGRGSGAAAQAMKADDNVQLAMMADVFEGQLEGSLAGLKKKFGDKVTVAAGDKHVGLDAYQKVLDSNVDMVILTTPPGFRPMMLDAAIKAGKHVFCEKPVAVDAPGVRSVLQSAQAAKSKGLSLVTGFCWRYHDARREFFKRIHDGAIGDIQSMFSTYYTGPVKPMPPESRRPEGMADVAWQIKNWYNFGWLSGDSLAEQAVHSVDKIGWAMKDADPISCVATGGRQIPANGGNIFDHFHIVYEFENKVLCHLGSRQQRGTHGENNDYIHGTKGQGIIAGNCTIKSTDGNWIDGPELSTDMYQAEHDHLFKSIREGAAVNDGEWMAHSTMLAIMGRMAAYTGKKITWEQALNSKQDLA
ncbi:MAG: putative dehydrogenase, partial [Verrucomicrobiales bacterium]